jgi:hypothetical protein
LTTASAPATAVAIDPSWRKLAAIGVICPTAPIGFRNSARSGRGPPPHDPPLACQPLHQIAPDEAGTAER